MELTTKLEDFSFKIFEEKTTTSKSKDDINNRIVYLPCTKEDLIIDIDSINSPCLNQLKILISQFEEKQDFMGIGVSTYEVKDLNALRKELTRIKALK